MCLCAGSLHVNSLLLLALAVVHLFRPRVSICYRMDAVQHPIFWVGLAGLLYLADENKADAGHTPAERM
jgi:hypothetical protein